MRLDCKFFTPNTRFTTGRMQNGGADARHCGSAATDQSNESIFKYGVFLYELSCHTKNTIKRFACHLWKSSEIKHTYVQPSMIE